MTQRSGGEIVSGLAWWTPEQWERLKRLSVDSDALDDTYRDWQRNVERAMKRLRRRGITVVKLEVDLDDLVTWCEKRGKQLDGEARSQYVAQKLSERPGQS